MRNILTELLLYYFSAYSNHFSKSLRENDSIYLLLLVGLFTNLVFSRFLSHSRRSNELILSIPPTAPLRPVLPFFVIR